MNLASALHRHSLDAPNAPAVVCGKTLLTYGQLASRAAQVAECLKQNQVSRSCDPSPLRVGILASRGIDACVALLGSCWAGATYVPLGTQLPEERILAILSQANLSAVIVGADGVSLLSEKVLAACPPLVIAPNASDKLNVPSGVTLVDSASLAVTDFNQPPMPLPMSADDTAYIIFTSGTTGIPKGVMISVGAATHYVRTMSRLIGLQASDRVLETFEPTFDVSVHNMFTTWYSGGSLYILPAAFVMNAIKFVRTHQITVWSLVSSFVGMFQQIRMLTPEALPSLRLTMFGGEPLTQGIVQLWKSVAPNSAIYNLYGPTEATVTCLAIAVTDTTPIMPGRDLVAIGYPLPGSETAVLDENGEIVIDGTQGELAVSGAQLAQGYLDAPEVTTQRFPTLHGKRWYLTGDRALREPSGVFHCLGRLDGQVKVFGYRIELEEIEAHLREITQATVVGAVVWPILDGVPQGIVGFIGGAPTLDEDAVLTALSTRLPSHMIPTDLIAMETMPFTQNGKLDRRALRQHLDANPRHDGTRR